ncbi:phosphatase PAP2 family protein [Escherichia coli]|nr:phosphatase PAP2 family protein [Escherichia coli]
MVSPVRSDSVAHEPVTQKFGHPRWPGGHAAAGFALFALFFALRDRRPNVAHVALIAATSLGTLFSLVRMAQGAHFFSHNLWTALLCWLICLTLYDLMLYRPQPMASTAPVTELR